MEKLESINVSVAIGVAMLMLLVLPFDLSQLFLMAVGAALASLVKPYEQKRNARCGSYAEKTKAPPAESSIKMAVTVPDRKVGKRVGGWAERHQGLPAAMPTKIPNVLGEKTESNAPVSAPRFNATNISAQVDEFVEQIAPSAACDHITEQLVVLVKRTVIRPFPDAEVVGVTFGDATRRTAFVVAVPEVHIVLRASPTALMRGLQDKLRSSRPDTQKLHKMAVQMCTGLLLNQAHFKFRRSLFTSSEPKVTLVAPPFIGSHSTGDVVLDFSVNAITPLCCSAVFQECGRMEARAKALIMLVKRWAKYRGLCLASKGHMSPYAWSLLTVYFLQVGLEDGPLLPPMQGSTTPQGCTFRSASDDFKFGLCSKDVSQLFQDFVRFYSKMSWSDEGVSVRKGKRAAPNVALPLNVIRCDGNQVIGPSIEDPFELKKNVGAGVTVEAMKHLRAELVRADDIMSRGTSLTELLEPWAPPDEIRSTSASSENGTDGSDYSGDQATDDLSGWRSTELRDSSERKPLRLKPRTIPCRTTTNLLQSTTSLRPGGGVSTSKLCVVA